MKKTKKENKKILKKGIALALAGTMIGTVFVGCSKKNLLEDTLLNDTEVVYVDDQPLIMSYNYSYDSCDGKHYKDIISGRVYHVANENAEGTEICVYRNVITLDTDTKRESITPYLTADELKKAQEENFSDEDVIAIQQRIAKEAKTLN